eukprot:244722_1
MSEENETPLAPTTAPCNQSFEQCTCSKRIKLILKKYNNIILDKNDKSESKLQEETNDLVHNLLANGQYSNVELLNDFHHVKYNHNTHNDSNQFNAFYTYLFADNEALNCDISHCHSSRRHYSRRDRSFMESNYSIDNSNAYSLYLISRIHVYFIHSSQLSSKEIEYIENQLKKFELKEDNPDVIND